MISTSEESLLFALRQDVSRVYGQRLETSTDFRKLSVAISESKAGYLSQSTLKRFWGYVRCGSSIRETTLDILARFIGYDDFKKYSNSLPPGDDTDSEFTASAVIDVASLVVGTRLRITWYPNCSVVLRYLGSLSFYVEMSTDPRLIRHGCLLKCMIIIKGHPLILSLESDSAGASVAKYIVGKHHGIDWTLI